MTLFRAVSVGVIAVLVFLATGDVGVGAITPAASKEAAAKAYVLRSLQNGEIGGPIDGRKVLSAHGQTALGNPSDVASANWSGYADDNSLGDTYTSVAATWTEPAVKKGCSSKTVASAGGTTLTAFWVGLDGFGGTTVEQDGATNVCYNGSAYSFDWYEMWPAGPVVVNSVNQGDEISASVNESGGTYTLVVNDTTNPSDSFTRSASCSPSTCLDQSAEWIGESPLHAGSASPYYPLTPYRKWEVTGASVNGKAISSYPDDAIHQYSSVGNYNLQEPGNLGAKGTKFKDKFLNSI